MNKTTEQLQRELADAQEIIKGLKNALNKALLENLEMRDRVK